MKIGVMGATIQNMNLGCLALAYSLVNCVTDVENEMGTDVHFVFFEWKDSPDSFQLMADTLGIPRDKFSFAPYAGYSDILRKVYHFSDIHKMKKAIKACDAIVDVTGGDSFSDIYGDDMFVRRTKVKLLVEKLGVPFILAPQTYGPYEKEKNARMAIKAIQGADYVYARDKESQKWIVENAGVEAIYTTDLAFLLPYEKPETERNDKIKVGINASNLLVSESSEMNDRRFSLSVNYEDYLDKILEILCNDDRYEVYLISHMTSDYRVHKILHEHFPKTYLVDPFSNPVDAKSLISTMDVFVGARMHGTIAAFTTDVACIPTAYSAKFSTFFSSLDYNVLVDLRTLSTDEAVSKTIEYIENYKSLGELIKECKTKNSDLLYSAKTELKKCLTSLLHKE